MKVSELIRAQLHWGLGRTRHLLTYIGASHELRAKDLTDRQRDLLCQFIGGRV